MWRGTRSSDSGIVGLCLLCAGGLGFRERHDWISLLMLTDVDRLLWIACAEANRDGKVMLRQADFEKVQGGLILEK